MNAAQWWALAALAVWAGAPGHLSRVIKRVPPRRRRAQPEYQDVWATVVESIATAVRSGIAPSVACAVACAASETIAPQRDRRALETLRTASTTGEALPQVWHGVADDLHDPALKTVAAAWQLSDSIGSPLADALAVAGAQRRYETERTARARAVLAAPNASVDLLTVLPLVGAGIGTVLGLDVWAVYTSPLALVTVFPGLLLIVVGRFWCRRMVAAAGRPRSLR